LSSIRKVTPAVVISFIIEERLLVCQDPSVYYGVFAVVRNLTALIAFIVLCELAGVIGSIFTIPTIPSWYSTLRKPWFNPPNWLFGPIWLILYFLMGLSLYLVFESGGNRAIVEPALWAFGVQLVLNVLWSVLFFGMHNLFYSFVEIVLLWISIAVTTVLFFMTSRAAAYLLLPYIVWVTFAALLNYYVFILNT
jgi:tryptophan-rich sensory protein